MRLKKLELNPMPRKRGRPKLNRTILENESEIVGFKIDSNGNLVFTKTCTVPIRIMEYVLKAHKEQNTRKNFSIFFQTKD